MKFRVSCALLLALAAPAAVRAQDANSVTPVQQEAERRPTGGEPHPLGQYAGLTPGTDRQPRHVAARTGRRPTVLTWPGFQGRPDGTSRIFIQSSAELSFEPREEQGRYVLLIRNARIAVPNNRRSLETRFFNTPVTRARLERRGRDLALVLEMRAAVTPSVGQARDANGYSYLFLAFPAGNYVPAELLRAPAARESIGNAPRNAPSNDGVLPTGADDPSFQEDNERPPALQGRAGP